MKTIDECSVATKRNNDLRTSLENGFCNIVNGEKIFISKTSPEIYPVATNQQLAAVSDVERALLALANSAARNAFPGWDAVPFERRKTILADVFNKIDENADELSARLAAKQGGTLAEAKWEIDLLTKSFGPVLVQMDQPDKKHDMQSMRHVTHRYVLINASGAVSPSKLPITLSFGKVLPALLAGETVVLRLPSFTPRTVMCIAEFIRELLPAGVFNVVTGEQDLLPGKKSHSGIDLVRFARSANLEKPARLPDTFEPEPEDSTLTTDPERSARFDNIVVTRIIRKPGRYGLASTLFEIFSFPPTRMKTQVLVWGLARKASYAYPSPGKTRNDSKPRLVV